MGCKVTEDGLSVQFYDPQGRPDGRPVFGRHAYLYGKRRDQLLTSAGPTADEQTSPGSDDWLTLIAVADSKERLDAMLQQTTVDPSSPDTSLSSRRVMVDVHVGDVRRTCENRITIANGDVTSVEPPRINVKHIKVLAAETQKLTDLPADSELPQEFEGGKWGFLPLHEPK